MMHASQIFILTFRNGRKTDIQAICKFWETPSNSYARISIIICTKKKQGRNPYQQACARHHLHSKHTMLELKKKVGSILPGVTQGIQIHYEGALFFMQLRFHEQYERNSGFSVSELVTGSHCSIRLKFILLLIFELKKLKK